MRRITLRLRTLQGSDCSPPRCGKEDETMSPDDEDAILDQLLGEPAEDDGTEEGELLELTTEALLNVSDGRLSIRYRESELTGMDGVISEISFALSEPDLVTVTRYGPVHCVIVLEPSRFHTGTYELPGMALEVTAHTLSLQNHLTEQGGSLRADYILRIGRMSCSRMRLSAEVLKVNCPQDTEGEN